MSIDRYLQDDILKCSNIAYEHGSILMVRPTFYDKHSLIAGIVNTTPGNILVVCTNSEDVNKVKSLINHSEYRSITYTTYRRLSFNNISINDGINTIIFNEAHLMLGENTEKSIIGILERFSNAARIGITSTPKRGDGREIDEYFHNNIDSSYSIRTAITDQDIPNIQYVTSLNIEYFRELILNRFSRKNETYINRIFNAVNLGDIIQKSMMKAYGEEKSELIIVAFVTGGKAIETSSRTLVDNIKHYFSGYKIQVFNTMQNLKKARQKSSDTDRKVINLVINPNINSLDCNIADCVVLLQRTTSSIRFIKRIGFSLRSGCGSIPIILDLVSSIDSVGITKYGQSNGKQRHDYKVVNENVNIEVYDARLDILDFLNRLDKIEAHQKSQIDIENYRNRERMRFEAIRRERYPWLYNSDGTLKQPKNTKVADRGAKQIDNRQLQEMAYKTIVKNLSNVKRDPLGTLIDSNRTRDSYNKIYNTLLAVVRRLYIKCAVYDRHMTWADIDERFLEITHINDVYNTVFNRDIKDIEGYTIANKRKLYHYGLKLLKDCATITHLRYRAKLIKSCEQMEKELDIHTKIEGGNRVRKEYFDEALKKALCQVGYGVNLDSPNSKLELISFTDTLYIFMLNSLMLKSSYQSILKYLNKRIKSLEDEADKSLQTIIELCEQQISKIG